MRYLWGILSGVIFIMIITISININTYNQKLAYNNDAGIVKEALRIFQDEEYFYNLVEGGFLIFIVFTFLYFFIKNCNEYSIIIKLIIILVILLAMIIFLYVFWSPILLTLFVCVGGVAGIVLMINQ